MSGECAPPQSNRGTNRSMRHEAPAQQRNNRHESSSSASNNSAHTNPPRPGKAEATPSPQDATKCEEVASPPNPTAPPTITLLIFSVSSVSSVAEHFSPNFHRTNSSKKRTTPGTQN